MKTRWDTSHGLAATVANAGRRIGAAVLWLIGPEVRRTPAEPSPGGVRWDWVTGLVLATTLSYGLLALGHFGGRRGEEWSGLAFWLGLLGFFLPWAVRICGEAVSRDERLLLVCLLGLASFGVKLLHAPTALVHFDEFLHWITFNDIVESHRLFLDNAMLPVSPLYPGLEILTAALAQLGGVSVFPAATLLLAVARVLFVGALFMVFERYSGSTRIAGMACLVYMGNSAFVLFDAQYAYESLAIVFVALVLLVEHESRHPANRRIAIRVLAPAFLFTLVVTHHLSSYFAAAYLVGLAVLEVLRAGDRALLRRLAWFAGLAVVLPLLWSRIVGSPAASYLGPIFEYGLLDVLEVISGQSWPRALFVGADGTSPAWLLQALSIAAVLLVSIGLATGFFRVLALSSGGSGSWRRVENVLQLNWRNSHLVLLALMTLAYPVSIALRLVPSTWEIGNRMSPFIFFGVGPVVATALVLFWAPLIDSRRRGLVLGLVLTAMFGGGVVSGWGVAAQRLPYKISADSLSVEPMAVQTARWTEKWLGPGNRFAADRVNRTLVATHGHQEVVTALYDRIDLSGVFFNDAFGRAELATIQRGQVDFLLVDLRLSQGPAWTGHYYELYGAENDHEGPPDIAALQKFNRLPGVNRVYDNGWIVLFDMRALSHAP